MTVMRSVGINEVPFILFEQLFGFRKDLVPHVQTVDWQVLIVLQLLKDRVVRFSGKTGLYAPFTCSRAWGVEQEKYHFASPLVYRLRVFHEGVAKFIQWNFMVAIITAKGEKQPVGFDGHDRVVQSSVQIPARGATDRAIAEF